MRKTMRYVKSSLLAALLLLTNLTYHPPALAATLLPNGMQTFLDGDGAPVAAGCVYFYVPGTLTPKDTYTDSATTTSNTNPVQLDAAGRAVIYGVGSYRQIVTKAGTTVGAPCTPPGDQVWDQLTADTSSSVIIYAGASGGTPNSITVTAPSFTGADGQVINYISTNTNSAAATLNPSGFGAIQIMRDSATGPGALTGGELVATNAVSVIYDATAGVFHILSPVNWPNTSGVPVGTIIPVAGFTAPTNYAFSYGQAVSRTSFSSLFSALTLGQTGSISSGSPTITGLADTTQLGYGMPVESTGIPGGTTLLSCTSTTCTMSVNATATRSGTMTFFAYGNGDGSTTFNLPDYRGLGMLGRDNMGNTEANNAQVSTTITTTSASASATVASATGLATGMYVISANVPANTIINAISGTTLTLSQNATATAGGVAARFSQFNNANVLGIKNGGPTQTLNLGNLPTGITSTNTAPIAVTFTANGTTSNFSGSATAGGSQVTGPATVNIAAQINTGAADVTSDNTLGLPTPISPPRRTVNFAVRLVP